MTAAHAFLPPSGAANWTACAHWARMNRDFPELGDKTAADEGTAAHAALAAAVEAGVAPEDEALRVAFDHITALPVSSWAIEQRREWRRVPENFGTPDFVGWAGIDLHVLDYKHGHGLVREQENLQLANYAGMVLEGLNPMFLATVTCHLTIIQPRCYQAAPVRTWTVAADDLRPYWNILQNEGAKALREDYPAKTGPQCLRCNGRHACVALRSVTQGAVDFSFNALPSPPTPEALAVELKVVRESIARLQALEGGLTEQATHLIRSGARVPGWQLKAGPGREAWRVPPADALAVGVPAKPAEPVTPAQARKAGLPDAIVAAMSERKPGAVALTLNDPKAAFS